MRQAQLSTTSSFRRQRTLAAAALLLAGGPLALGSSDSARADAIGDALNSTATSVAPSVVSLRAIETVTRKANGQSENQDFTVQFKGVVVSADGLVMCTNSYISSDALRTALGVPADVTDTGITVAPQEIRITVGSEASEYYGTVAATDANLGLAFIQIRDLNGRQLPFVDIALPAASSPAPAVGDVTESVTRLDKSHDYAPSAVLARLVGVIAKPRRAYLADSDPGALGLPVYANGVLIGVTTYLPSGDQTADDRFTQGLARLFDDYVSLAQNQFILPVANVAPLIDLAKKQASALPPFTVPKPRPASGTANPSAIKPAPPAKPTTPTTPSTK